MTTTQPEYVTRQELATLVLELRADRAEVRLDASALRQEIRESFADFNRRLDTLIDSLTDFRKEYQQHTHD